MSDLYIQNNSDFDVRFSLHPYDDFAVWLRDDHGSVYLFPAGAKMDVLSGRKSRWDFLYEAEDGVGRMQRFRLKNSTLNIVVEVLDGSNPPREYGCATECGSLRGEVQVYVTNRTLQFKKGDTLLETFELGRKVAGLIPRP